MAFKIIVLPCIILLAVTSAALAQPGRGGPPGGQGGSGGPSGGPGGPGGPGGLGGEPHGPPLNLTAVGNLTGDVGARLANCSADQTAFDGRFHLSILINSSGNYNLLLEARLVDASGGPPDSLAIVQGAVCDAAATTVLSLPVAAADWQQRAGWWLLHSETTLHAFLENADASTVDALLALLPNATLPRLNGTGGRGGNGGGNRTGAGAGPGGSGSGQGGRRMGLGLRAVGFATQMGKKVGGTKQGGQQQGGQQRGGAQQLPPAGAPSGGFPGGVNATVAGYAVLAASSASGATWGGQLMGVKIPSPA